MSRGDKNNKVMIPKIMTEAEYLLSEYLRGSVAEGERRRVDSRKRKAKNREREMIRDRQWYANNKKKHKAWVNKWRIENRERWNENCRNAMRKYYARKRAGLVGKKNDGSAEAGEGGESHKADNVKGK